MFQDPEKIARLLHHQGTNVSLLEQFLEELRDQNCINPEYVNEVSKGIQLLKKAGEIAANGKCFLFKTVDSWSDSEGYTLFKLIGESLETEVGMWNAVPRQEEITEYCKKKSIFQVFTTQLPPEGRWGLEPENTHDQDTYTHSCLNKRERAYFRKDGIEVLLI